MRYNDFKVINDIPLSWFRRRLWLHLRIRPLRGSCHRGTCPNGMFLWNPIWSDKQLYKLCTYFCLLLGRAGHILHMCQHTLCTFWDFWTHCSWIRPRLDNDRRMFANQAWRNARITAEPNHQHSVASTLYRRPYQIICKTCMDTYTQSLDIAHLSTHLCHRSSPCHHRRWLHKLTYRDEYLDCPLDSESWRKAGQLQRKAPETLRKHRDILPDAAQKSR